MCVLRVMLILRLHEQGNILLNKPAFVNLLLSGCPDLQELLTIRHQMMNLLLQFYNPLAEFGTYDQHFLLCL